MAEGPTRKLGVRPITAEILARVALGLGAIGVALGLAATDFGGERLPAWLEAVGTVGAFSVGIYEVIRFKQREADRLEREEMQRVRAQAEMVSVWFYGAPKTPQGYRTAHVAISNMSSMPIFDLMVRVGPNPGWGLSVVGPQHLDGPTYEVYDTRADVQKEEGRLVEPEISATFRDAAGRWWQRTSEGDLEAMATRPFVDRHLLNSGTRPEPSKPVG